MATYSWTDIRDGWDDRWEALEDAAYETYGPHIERQAHRYAAQVKAFVAALDATEDHLEAADTHIDSMEHLSKAAALKDRKKHRALQERYNALAAGLWANSEARGGESEAEVDGEFGLAPLVVVATVAGVGVSTVGVAWAVAYNSHAVALQKETELFTAELAARVKASKEGRALPPATIPRQPTPSPKGGAGSSSSIWPVVGLGVVAVAAGGFLLVSRR